MQLSELVKRVEQVYSLQLIARSVCQVAKKESLIDNSYLKNSYLKKEKILPLLMIIGNQKHCDRL